MTDNAQAVSSPSAAATLTAASFPPYGIMPAEFSTSITGQPPPIWPSATNYATWLKSVVDLLNKLLWPAYSGNQTWTGDAGTNDCMVRLTQADFALWAAPAPATGAAGVAGGIPASIQLAPGWIHGSNETTTVGPIMTASAPSSAKSSWIKALAPATLFNQEDVTYAVVNTQMPGAMHASRITETLGFSRTFRSYMDGTLPPALIDQFGRLYDALCLSNDYSFVLQIKDVLQRPRPYQMSKIFGNDDFQHNQAVSSVTPSMPNGHAFQSAMYGTRLAYAIQIHASAAQSTAALPILKQHTVDIGDRRVLAHVHYPSDSLASWILALLLQSELPPPENSAAAPGFGNRFLVDAITNYSENYKAMLAAATADTNSRYTVPLKIIQYFATYPTAKIGDVVTEFGL